MNIKCTLSLLVLICISNLLWAAPFKDTETYPVDPASARQPDVPKGTVTQYSFSSSNIFPGTVRDYWVYIPAQYQDNKPTCLMVFQDGRRFASEKGPSKMPIVFDNLIHSAKCPSLLLFASTQVSSPLLRKMLNPDTIAVTNTMAWAQTMPIF